MEPTYTVRTRHGDVIERGLSLAQAADTVLGHDGHEYEVRQAETGFELWVSNHSRNSTAYNGLTRSVIRSLNQLREHAEADIWRQVLRNGEWWGGQYVVTDADYDAEMAELEAAGEFVN